MVVQVQVAAAVQGGQRAVSGIFDTAESQVGESQVAVAELVLAAEVFFQAQVVATEQQVAFDIENLLKLQAELNLARSAVSTGYKLPLHQIDIHQQDRQQHLGQSLELERFLLL